MDSLHFPWTIAQHAQNFETIYISQGQNLDCHVRIWHSQLFCKHVFWFNPQVRPLDDIYRNYFLWTKLKRIWVSKEGITVCNWLHLELQHRGEWFFAFLLFSPLSPLEISQPSVSQTLSLSWGSCNTGSSVLLKNKSVRCHNFHWSTRLDPSW